MSYNVRGLADKKKRSKVFKFLHHKPADIICVQETHSTKSDEKLWKTQFGGQVFYSHGKSNACGCMILVKRNVKTKIHHVINDNFGRYNIIKITIGTITMIMCNLYAPNVDDISFFQEVFSKIESFNVTNIVIVGDFNTALTKEEIVSSKGNINPGHPKCASFIGNFMTEHSIVDIWRLRHLNEKRFTWVKSKPSILMERLDYILIATSLSAEVLTSGIDPSFMSDHALPFIVFKDPELTNKGPGYWKLNVRHLEDESYEEMITENITRCQNEIADSKLRWEITKLKVKGESIKYGVRKKKSLNNQLQALECKLCQVKSAIDNSTSENFIMFNEHENQMTLIQKDIENIIAAKTLRSKVTNEAAWQAYGEKPTKNFFALETNKKKKPISRIKIENKLIGDPDQILGKVKEFYTELFRSRVTDVEELCSEESWQFIDDLELPKVSDEDRALLEEPISLGEIEIAIKQLNVDKVAGLDGLPIEFYQKFLPVIKNDLHSLFLKIVQDGVLHSSAKQGIISLLEKAGKDQLYIEHWRPLSLYVVIIKSSPRW